MAESNTLSAREPGNLPGNEGNVETPTGVDAATQEPDTPPTQEATRAAIAVLQLQHPSLGWKKLKKILNADQKWSITNEDFRCHFEAIIANTAEQEKQTKGTKDDHTQKMPTATATARAKPKNEPNTNKPPTNVSVTNAKGQPRKLSEIFADIEKEQAQLHAPSSTDNRLHIFHQGLTRPIAQSNSNLSRRKRS